LAFIVLPHSSLDQIRGLASEDTDSLAEDTDSLFFLFIDLLRILIL
jgi:hypothetical protein